MFGDFARQSKKQDGCLMCIHVAQVPEAIPINDLHCRRFPPTLHRNELDELKPYYPPVGVTNWCGEFQRRKGSIRQIK